MTNGQREDQLSIKNWTEGIGRIQSQKLNTPSHQALSIQRTVRSIGRDLGQNLEERERERERERKLSEGRRGEGEEKRREGVQ
jgi:hypothetical protein